MSNKRYIELSSTYRNRNLYPNAADFSVQIADSGSTTDGTKAYNPLSKSYPFYNFTGAPSTAVRSGLLVGAAPPPAGLGTTGTIGGGPAPPPPDINPFGSGNSSAPNLNYVNVNGVPNVISSNIDRYYEGMQFHGGTATVTPVNSTTSSRIAIYDGEKRKCTLDNSLSGIWGTAGSYPAYLIDNADSDGRNAANPTVRIQGGEDVEAYYNGFWLEDTGQGHAFAAGAGTAATDGGFGTTFATFGNIFKRIISYDSTSRMATLESPYGDGSGTNGALFPLAGGGWNPVDTYRMRGPELPLVMGWGTHGQNPVRGSSFSYRLSESSICHTARKSTIWSKL